MTSPAISKSNDNQKGDKKSPNHSANGVERTSSQAGSKGAGTDPNLQPEPFSWLRIFKLADLMMKQGC